MKTEVYISQMFVDVPIFTDCLSKSCGTFGLS